MLHHGLYEQVINNALTSELAEIPEARKAVAPIDKVMLYHGSLSASSQAITWAACWNLPARISPSISCPV